MLGVVQRLVWTGRLLEDLLERSAGAGGLRHRGDYEVLVTLRRTEPITLTPTEISSQLRTSASGMTGKLDRLEKRSLIERSTDASDRRIVRVGLTDYGREIAEQAFMINLSFYRNFFAALDRDELQNLDRQLIKVLERADQLAQRREPWDASTRFDSHP